MIYRVQKGDTLSDIAKKHGVKLSELARVNEIENINIIYVGQILDIPEPDPVEEFGVSYADIGRALVRYLSAAENTDEYKALCKLLNG